MHLKRLEAFGFKSFADKVVFEFEKGMTVFVGPNGCGKSNVVDAVKWVLGDQSAKSMRGTEMLDVIFNGSANRKPLNFAEVTLTFDNTDQTLRMDAPEVSVSRRLYRSGESEYLINKALCRLLDIRQLFWDTGAGTSSYSIIEQGKIGVLLEANAKERRLLLEEAAGIHKYKERKKVALRRLERVELNLARVSDFIAELDRNLRAVTRQAVKARKARELGDRLHAIKLDLLLSDAFSGRASLEQIEAALASARDQVQALSTELLGAQAQAVGQQEQMEQLDGRLAGTRASLADERAGQARLEEAIRGERRSIEEMQAEGGRARQTAQESGKRAAAAALERERIELDLVKLQEALAERQAGVQARSADLLRDQERLAQLVQELEEARRSAVEILGKKTQTQNLLGHAEAETNGIDYRIRSARAEITRAEDQLRFAQRELEEIRRRGELTRKHRATLEGEQAGLRNLQLVTENEIERVAGQAQDLRNELEKCRSRRAVLEDLTESGEGLSPGAHAVLNDFREVWAGGDDLYGLVADCLGVEPRLEAAIEAVLGPDIEALVVSREGVAKELLRRLREDGYGRATFLALDRLQVRPPGAAGLDPAELAHTGCLGRAADLVACDPELRPVAEVLLGAVLVYEDLEQAEAARAAGGQASCWARVTLAGELLAASGVISGGKHRLDRLGLIGRRNEIARLDRVEEECGFKIEAREERIAFLERRAQKLARDEERLSSNLAALSLTATELKGLLAAIQREESRSAEERNLASQEICSLEAQREAFAARARELRVGLEELRNAEVEGGRRVEGLRGILGEQERLVGEGRGALEELRRDVSTLQVRVEGLGRHLESLASQFAEWRDEADRETRRADALSERVRAVGAEVEEKERTAQLSAERILVLDRQAADLAEAKDLARLRFEEARGSERTLAGRLEEARSQTAEVERQRFEAKLGLDGKLDQARREFKLDLEQELATRGEPPQISAEMKEEADRLEQVLQRLGPVNMYALEEQKQLEDRLSFYQGQAQDLESARASVKDVVARINRRSRKQFEETFEAVRENFQQIFRKLFGGGKVELLLEEGEDILEAGIEIRARPPGKEPRSIMQLSGGEKALTTIALLFAVFRSRPAPFCILDEVDAPLDEANVDRFNMILQEFMDKSQFVVITHNKRTMQYANVLYGITMPEPGVSKRIAVKYEQIEEQLPMDQINRQAVEARETSLRTLAVKTEGPFDSSTV